MPCFKLEWVAISFFKGSSQPRDRTQVSHIAGRFFTVGATQGYCFNARLIQIFESNAHLPGGEDSFLKKKKKKKYSGWYCKLDLGFLSLSFSFYFFF